jgi:hypothetical protein
MIPGKSSTLSSAASPVEYAIPAPKDEIIKRP